MNARCSYQSIFMLLRFLPDLSRIVCNILFSYSSIHSPSRLLRDWGHPRARDKRHPVPTKLLPATMLPTSSSFRHDRLFTKFPYQPSSSPNQVPHLIELPPSSAFHQVPLLIKLPISNSGMTKFYTCPIQCCIHASFSAQYTLHSAFGREFSGELDGSLAGLAGGW